MTNMPGQSLEVVNAAIIYPPPDVAQEESAEDRWHAGEANGHAQSSEANGHAEHSFGDLQPVGKLPPEPISLSEVYEKAGVKPPAHGFTVLKVADMLASSYIRDLPAAGKRSSILMALEASNVQLNDVLEDGARREAALNDYENRQQKAFLDFKAQKQQQSQQIQAEIDRLVEKCRARIQANDQEVATEKARVDEWRSKKREEERRIRSATSPFVTNGSAAQQANNTEPIATATTSPVDSPSEIAPPEAPVKDDHGPAPRTGTHNGKPSPIGAAHKADPKKGPGTFWKR
jgi:hypothetical protein